MTKLNEFKIGDRVKHVLRNQEGKVYSIEEEGLHVHFDSRTPRGNIAVGVYDDDWFRLHPDMLVNLSR
jgi:hypothetical protein